MPQRRRPAQRAVRAVQKAAQEALQAVLPAQNQAALPAVKAHQVQIALIHS